MSTHKIAIEMTNVSEFVKEVSHTPKISTYNLQTNISVIDVLLYIPLQTLLLFFPKQRK